MFNEIAWNSDVSWRDKQNNSGSQNHLLTSLKKTMKRPWADSWFCIEETMKCKKWREKQTLMAAVGLCQNNDLKLQFCIVLQYILKEMAAGLLLFWFFVFVSLQLKHTEKFKTIYHFYDSRLMPTKINTDKPLSTRCEHSSFPAVPGLCVL